MMLKIKYIPSSHMVIVIANSLHKIILDQKLEDYIISITTDNGINMVTSIPLLKNKFEYSNILHLPYTAYTLQLAIIKELSLAEVLVVHAKRLIRFFVIQK